MLPFLQVGCDRCQVMNIKESILVAVRRTIGSRFFDYVLGRCDADGGAAPTLPHSLPIRPKGLAFHYFPPFRRPLLFISLSLAVELTLTRLPLRSAPPPPTPRALCPARRARFALPQSNRAPAAPAPRRVSPCARLVRPWRLKPPQDPAFEPWSPAAAAHPGVELCMLALLQEFRTFTCRSSR